MAKNIPLRFTDEAEARKHLEALRWPSGPECPHCGVVNEASSIKGGRKGLWFCNACREQFTVTVGTVFERSKIPLNTWLYANHLLCSSKKGISSHQLARMLGVTYKTAWFMSHRIREAMTPTPSGPLGGDGKIVEADTTYVGGKEKNKHLYKRNEKNIGGAGKQIVHSLVERGGHVHSDHIANVSGKTLRPILAAQVHPKSSLMTDTAGGYMAIGKTFARHEMVDHSADEYVRGDAHSNTVEGYFATLKRGIIGTYHHVSPAHLKRYLGEFDFRYNERIARGVDDTMRADKALEGIAGKRLTYRATKAQNVEKGAS
jgi:transposase-like protein